MMKSLAKQGEMSKSLLVFAALRRPGLFSGSVPFLASFVKIDIE